MHFNLHLKADREGASLTSCFNPFQTLAPRNENAFWLLLVFIRGASKSVSQLTKDRAFWAMPPKEMQNKISSQGLIESSKIF